MRVASAILVWTTCIACSSTVAKPDVDDVDADGADGELPGDGILQTDVDLPDEQPDDFWMPAPAKVTNVNRNSASDVDIDGGVAAPGKWYNGFYGGNSFAGMVYAWNAAVWADGYSPAGAMAFFGGGHGANIGCISYLFDVSERRWVQVGASLNLPPVDNWSGGHPYEAANDARDPDWYDYDYNGSRIILLPHEYASVAYLSPSEGGAPSVGSLLVPNAEWDQTAGYASRWGAWTFSLLDGRMARSLAGVPGEGVGSGALVAVKDTVNHKLWYFRHGSSQVRYHDLTEEVPRPLHEETVTIEPSAPNDGYMPVYDWTWVFVHEARAAIAFAGSGVVGGGMSAVYIDFSSGHPVMANVAIPPQVEGSAGFAHGGLNPGVDWDSKRKRFVIYEGLGDTITHVLTPSSSNFRTATWTWSREAYSGRTPANGWGSIGAATSLQGGWGRFRYVEALDVFLWIDAPGVSAETEDGSTRDGIAQFWHPQGDPL